MMTQDEMLADDGPIEMDSMNHEDEFQEIEDLQKHGISAVDVAKLKVAGLHSIKAIFMHTRKSLLNIKGMSDLKVEKIKEAAAKLLGVAFISGTEYLAKRSNLVRLTTGSKEFDKLLGGGIESMALTEVFGEFRTGKTQLCLTLCVTCQLPTSMGGGGGKAAYIDTEGTFRPERIVQIAQRFDLDPDTVLGNVMVARPYNSDVQMELLAICAAKFAEERGQYKLLIIDSIMSLFRVDFCGRGELAERQQKLNQMLSRLLKIADEFNVAVVVTNQMTSDPGAGMTFVADPKKPVGGNVMAHAATVRLSLRKGRGESRVCKVYDSPNLPANECVYEITEGGIADSKE